MLKFFLGTLSAILLFVHSTAKADQIEEVSGRFLFCLYQGAADQILDVAAELGEGAARKLTKEYVSIGTCWDGILSGTKTSFKEVLTARVTREGNQAYVQKTLFFDPHVARQAVFVIWYDTAPESGA